MRSLPQELHADLGLVDDDHIEDMRKAPVAADALPLDHHVVTTTTDRRSEP
jgi:hypothetical protein